jgi:putative SOS response-associated peptidase YedK
MPPEGPTPHGAASWHVAPPEPLPIVREDAQNHRRSRQGMCWGLVPCWVKASTAGVAHHQRHD